MEVKYSSKDGQFQVVFDVKAQNELFEQIASFQEVFETPAEVVIAGKVVPAGDVQFRVREVDDNKYYEKVYVGNDRDLWGYKLPYGQNKKGGGLFPKHRIDEEDLAKYDNGGGGWRRFKRDQQSRPQPQQQRRQPKQQEDDEVPF
jgi:hypothetical protein